MMQARQKAAAKLAAEAQKAAYEAAKKEAVEKEAAKLRAEAVSTSVQISQNSVAHATMVNSIEIKSELPGASHFCRTDFSYQFSSHTIISLPPFQEAVE
jgi:nucleoporin GLE1